MRVAPVSRGNPAATQASVPPAKAPPAPPTGYESSPEPAPAAAASQPIKLDPFFEVRTPARNFGPARLSGGVSVTPLARRLASEAGIDLSRLPKLCRDVTERVIHASADFDYFTDLVCVEEALAEGVGALVAGAPVIADTAMVAAGITASPVICKINEPLTQRLARTASIS